MNVLRKINLNNIHEIVFKYVINGFFEYMIYINVLELSKSYLIVTEIYILLTTFIKRKL